MRVEDTGMRVEDTGNTHPPDISKYIYNWKYMHGEYIAYDCECDRIFHHATLGLDAYAHITSPIRRLVDVINMSLLSLNSDTHMHMYNEWTRKMPYLNTQMKSIQQVQNTCALLEKITTYPDISRETFTGYIFDSNMVYIPKLRITSKYTKTICSDSKSNETIGNFGVFLFSDEFNVPQKIRICQK